MPDEGHDSNVLPDEWRYLPFLALPDGAHNYQEGRNSPNLCFWTAIIEKTVTGSDVKRAGPSRLWTNSCDRHHVTVLRIPQAVPAAHSLTFAVLLRGVWQLKAELAMVCTGVRATRLVTARAFADD